MGHRSSRNDPLGGPPRSSRRRWRRRSRRTSWPGSCATSASTPSRRPASTRARPRPASSSWAACWSASSATPASTTRRSTTTASCSRRCPAAAPSSACSRTWTPARTRPGAGVEPIVHRGYDGGAIELPRGGTVLDPVDMPVLAGKAGHDIVTSSGDTLLGADDKAGVAEIMAAVAHLAANPELPRPTLRVGFTPDEEVGGLGASRFDLDRFGAAVRVHARRLAAGRAAGRDVLGRRDHADRLRRRHPPGLGDRQARQRRDAGRRASSPSCPYDRLTPATTADRDGFVHVHEVTATAALAEIKLIARDFDDDLLARARRARAPDRRAGRGRGAARAARGRGAVAVPEHAPLPQGPPGGRRAGRGGDPRRGPRGRPRRRSAAAPTARSSAPAACRHRTCSPAGTSTTRCASGRRCRTWRRPPRRSCGSPTPGPQPSRRAGAGAPACARPPRRPSASTRARARPASWAAAAPCRRAPSCRPSARSRSSPPTRRPAR